MLFFSYFFFFFWSVASLSWDANPRYGKICWNGCRFPVRGPETLSVFFFLCLTYGFWCIGRLVES